jgi:PTS system cellobiose-specific IIA component
MAKLEEEQINPMKDMSPEEKSEYVVNKAMEIILYSGDARNFAAQAMNEISAGNYGEAEKLLKQAEEVQTKAHVIQTEMLQGDIRGGDEKMQYSVLFAHAQDTLMTIQVELNMTKSMMKFSQALDARIAAVNGAQSR